MSTGTALGLHSSSHGFNLAILPLLSTTTGLFYAIVEPTIFVPFLRAADTQPAETSKVVRLWWTHFLPYGLVTILSIGTATATSSIYLLRRLERGSQEWNVTAAGLAFGLGHFLFVPKISATIAQTVDEEVETKGQTVETLSAALLGWYLEDNWAQSRAGKKKRHYITVNTPNEMGSRIY